MCLCVLFFRYCHRNKIFNVVCWVSTRCVWWTPFGEHVSVTVHMSMVWRRLAILAVFSLYAVVRALAVCTEWVWSIAETSGSFFGTMSLERGVEVTILLHFWTLFELPPLRRGFGTGLGMEVGALPTEEIWNCYFSRFLGFLIFKFLFSQFFSFIFIFFIFSLWSI